MATIANIAYDYLPVLLLLLLMLLLLALLISLLLLSQLPQYCLSTDWALVWQQGEGGWGACVLF